MAETYAVGEALKARYDEVIGRVGDAARRSGRRDTDVMLVAVTKYAEQDQIRELIAHGQRDFGENKVQSLIQRAAMVEEYLARHRVLTNTKESSVIGTAGADMPDAVRWHMIGHLQRNKARKAAECSRLIHTVDSLRLAEELQAIGLKRDEPIDVLVQVNCSQEPQKYGCAPPATLHLVEQIDTMVFVRARGLMTMAPLVDNPEEARPTFGRCRELFEDISKAGVCDNSFNILSMGMSGDYEAAIEEGANLVRVGSAIFGSPMQE